MQVQSLGWGDALEEGMATHSGILTWRIPWTEEHVTHPHTTGMNNYSALLRRRGSLEHRTFSGWHQKQTSQVNRDELATNPAQQLLCARPCSKHLSQFNSFNLHYNPVKYILLICLFLQTLRESSERLSGFPKVTQLAGGRAKRKAHPVWL